VEDAEDEEGEREEKETDKKGKGRKKTQPDQTTEQKERAIKEKKCKYRPSLYKYVGHEVRGVGPLGINFYYKKIHLISKSNARKYKTVKEGDLLQDYNDVWYKIVSMYASGLHIMFVCTQIDKNKRKQAATKLVHIPVDSVVAFEEVETPSLEQSKAFYEEVERKYKEDTKVHRGGGHVKAVAHEGLTKEDKATFATLLTKVNELVAQMPEVLNLQFHFQVVSTWMEKMEAKFQKLETTVKEQNTDLKAHIKTEALEKMVQTQDKMMAHFTAMKDRDQERVEEKRQEGQKEKSKKNKNK
jgi:hypothetical protein